MTLETAKLLKSDHSQDTFLSFTMNLDHEVDSVIATSSDKKLAHKESSCGADFTLPKHPTYEVCGINCLQLLV